MLNQTKDSIESWMKTRSWYQRIELSNGLVTPGWVDCKGRLPLLAGARLSGSSVIDIGCNSGFYCLWAKKQNASRVVGVDIKASRIEEARVLAEIEGLEVEFHTKQMAEVRELGRFDYVFSFAVVTEIPDLLGSLNVLKHAVGRKAFVELALAKPVFQISSSWLRSVLRGKSAPATLELRPSGEGWALSPSLKAIRLVMGNEFGVSYLGKGLRYEMICIERLR